MDKTEVRDVINYFILKDLTPTDIQKKLDSTLKDSFPSFSTGKDWAIEFKCGIQDNERSGRPKTATTEEIVTKIHNFALSHH